MGNRTYITLSLIPGITVSDTWVSLNNHVDLSESAVGSIPTTGFYNS